MGESRREIEPHRDIESAFSTSNKYHAISATGTDNIDKVGKIEKERVKEDEARDYSISRRRNIIQ